MRLVPSKRKRKKGRRSRSRLGHRYETAAPDITLVLKPVSGFWRDSGGRIFSFLALAALLWLCSRLFATDTFYVYEATVVGNHFVPAEEIYAASGLDGVSIFYVDPAQIEAAVASLPMIKSARVDCRLPARVTIEVVERQPDIVWQTAEGRYWIDAEGTVMAPRGDLRGALTVVDLDNRALPPGQRIEADVLDAVRRLHQLMPELTTVHYSHDKGLHLFPPEGYPVYLGGGEALEQRVAIMKALLPDLRARGIRPQFVDLRFEGRPYYR